MDGVERSSRFGTLFEWTPAGKDDLIAKFRGFYPDTDNVPFVSYDQQNHMFVLKTDDERAVKIFAATFKSVLDYNQGIRKKKEIFDFTNEELVKPIEGTVLPEIDDSGNILQHFDSGVDLILVDDDSDEDDSTDNTSLGGLPSLYWSPQCGDISILPTETAAAIANLTNCMICKEPESRRVRLINGDIYMALEKLQRLEALLEKTANHRAGHASNVDVNLLYHSSQVPGTGVRYVRVMLFPHLDRVIVQPALEERLEEATVGEEYVWSQSERRHIRSENFATANSDVQAVPARPSTIWARFKVPTIGDPENVVPRTPSGGSSVASGDKKRSSMHSPAEKPSKFLPIQDQARLREWSRNVDTGADPAVPAEQPVEPEVEGDQTPITKRFVEDSDSDVGIRRDSAPSNTRLIAVESDEEGKVPRKAVATQAPRQTAPPQTARAQDSEARARQTRLDRASRYRATAPVAPTNSPMQTKTNIVGADSFFKGIPRDEDEPEKPAPAQITSNAAGHTIPQRTQSRAIETPQPRRGLRFDGAADGIDEINNGIETDGISISTPVTHRDLEPQPYTPSAAFNPSGCDPGGRQPPGPVTAAKTLAGPANQSNSEPFPRRFPSQQARPENPIARDSPVNSWPKPGINRDFDGRRGREVQQGKHRDQAKQLIDTVDDDPKAIPVAPPPGLTIRQTRSTASVEVPHILDNSLDEVQRASVEPNWDPPAYTNEETSFSASNYSGGVRPSPLHYTPQTQLVKPDINLMHDHTLARLQAIRDMQRKKASRSSTAAQTSERIEKEDEVDTRKFHDTMNLKAPNPGKGKKKSKGSAQESAAQQAERIAATMADAYGPGPKVKPFIPVTTTMSRGNPDPPSERVQQLAKSNPIMAATHSDTLQNNARSELTDILVHKMRPMFEAARSFAGDLWFAIEIGNLLVIPSSLIKEDKIYEPGRWAKVFNGTNMPPEVKFNDIVTCDGLDIDNILEMKSRSNKAMKTWNKNVPGPSRMEFEFQCQDNAGKAFKLRFDTDGTYSIDEGRSIIGKVGIQCPGRTWDACAVLGGNSTWRYLPDDLDAAVADMVSSIYVNAEEAMAIHFRIPSSNAFTVHDVVVHRISLHECQTPEQQDIQLKITERKLLYTRSHRIDKRLYFSFEKSHQNMAENHRVHYEISVVHKGIAQAFKANQQLEVGELTASETTGASLLAGKSVEVLLNAALTLIDKIDWVGKRNYGTLVRRRDERSAREQELARIAPPATHASLVRPVHLNLGHSIVGPRTAIGSRTNVGSRFPASTQTALPIHGIRAGTQAQVYKDASGNLFRIGQGGAQIPVIREDGDSVDAMEILPNDSASQIGRQPRAGKSPLYDDKPAGFW